MDAGPDDARPQAVFFDRDGTLIEHVAYLSDPGRVVLLPGVRETAARLQAAAVRMFLFTNQSGVGRGVNRRMIECMGLGDDLFAGVCIAAERPDEPSAYRKPSPRFIHETLARHDFDASRAWMVGDAPSDWEAGLSAGVSVAAIVSGGADEAAHERRLQLGVPAYPSLLDWATAVFA